ncbi:MAG: 50S ribosomal protein L31 [Alphaproteobacteria bacterium]|nr:50S ribosomal protein L31 [Alphaproteobacteria bacterium]
MKKGIHPEYKEITYIMTDGEERKTRSTYAGKTVRLDVDVKTHHAWTGARQNLIANDQLNKYNKRFSGFTPKK